MSSFKIVGQIENIVNNEKGFQYSTFVKEDYLSSPLRGEGEESFPNDKSQRNVKVATDVLTSIFMFILGVLGVVCISAPTIISLLYWGKLNRKSFLFEKLKRYSDSAKEFMSNSIEKQEKDLIDKLKTSKNLSGSEEDIVSGVLARVTALEGNLEKIFTGIELKRIELSKGRSNIDLYLSLTSELKVLIKSFKEGTMDYLKKSGYEGDGFQEIENSEVLYSELVAEYMKYLQNEMPLWSINNIWALFTKEKLQLPDTFGLR